MAQGAIPDAVEFLPLNGLFASANEAVTPEGFLHVFPQIYDCEGFFVARLRKTQAVEPLPAPTFKVGNFPFAPMKRREAEQVTTAAAKVGLAWMTHAIFGFAIKRFGFSRQILSRLSARYVFPASGSASRKCTIKAIAGSMRLLSPSPAARIRSP